MFLDWLFFLEEKVFKSTSLPKEVIQGTSPGATRLSTVGTTGGVILGASPRAGLAVGAPLAAHDGCFLVKTRDGHLFFQECVPPCCAFNILLVVARQRMPHLPSQDEMPCAAVTHISLVVVT